MGPVEQLCVLLRESEDYVVLRNADVSSNFARGGDLDLLVRDVRSFSRQLIANFGPPLVYMERSYVRGFFWSWGHVDLLPTVEWHGAVYVDTQEVLRAASRNSHGFWEASLPHQAVISWFSSLLWGGFFKDRYRDIVIRAACEHAEDFLRTLGYAVGPFWARRLLGLAQAGRPEASVASVRILRLILWWRVFLRSPVATITGWVHFWLKELWLRVTPPVPWVAVLGMDGSGKSSVLEAIKQRLGYGRPFVSVQLIHWSPRRLRKARSSGPVVDPHGKPPRGVFVSIMKVVALLVNWVLGYWLDIAHPRAKGILVAFDRHYVDLLVDPKRYRYGGPMWFARFVKHLIPKPDLVIILDLPAEVSHLRKPEVPLEEAKRLRERYLELAASLPNAHVLDASRPLEEVVEEACSLILRYTAERTERRIRRLGLW